VALVTVATPAWAESGDSPPENVAEPGEPTDVDVAEPVSDDPAPAAGLESPAASAADLSPAAELPSPGAPAEVVDPRLLGARAALTAADALLDAHEIDAAYGAYDRVASDFPGTSEARTAERVMRALNACVTVPTLTCDGDFATDAPAAGAPGAAAAPTQGAIRRLLGRIVIPGRPEPVTFSLETGEAIGIPWWEHLEFMVTAAAYGITVGLAFDAVLIHSSNETVIPPILLAVGFGGSAALYAAFGSPDRGDYPLALTIMAGVPAAALMITAIASGPYTSAGRNIGNAPYGVAVGVGGVAAVPLALLLAAYVDVDPGDMQLVRDAGALGARGRRRPSSAGGRWGPGPPQAFRREWGAWPRALGWGRLAPIWRRIP
jgi:hypothetical protein